MKPADRHPLLRTTTAAIWRALVTIALSVLLVPPLVHAEETELPLPYPSAVWSSPGISDKPLFEAPPGPGSNNACQSQDPCVDSRAQLLPFSSDDFSPRPLCDQPYNACDELNIYG